MNKTTSLALVGIAGLGCFGCGGPSESDEARTWATSSSATAVYWNMLHEPVAIAQGERTFGDPACPVTSDDGTVLTITGDCTTTDGQQRFGTATITRGATSGDLALVFDGYGQSTDLGDVRTTGTASVTRRGADLHDFSVDAVVVALNTTTVDYEGSVRGTYDAPTTWNGTGSIERSGFAPTGRVLATTVDERFDGSVCSGQPVSGATTIMREGRTDVITYDGALDCDAAKAAQWSVNGASRGLLTDISCSASPGSRSPVALATSMLAGLALLVRRTRRRAST